MTLVLDYNDLKSKTLRNGDRISLGSGDIECLRLVLTLYEILVRSTICHKKISNN